MTTGTDLAIRAGGVTLEADVTVPDEARGAILFAHGTGSSRHSPRNRMVAGQLGDAGFATVLADLLTAAEEEQDARTGDLRFDIGLLTGRMTALVDWSTEAEEVRGLPVGLFGASTGAAAALMAAAQRPEAARAVVSRGGRPDLAAEALPQVRAPTLLIVGDHDPQVLRLNEQAAELLSAPHRVHLVAGATHLFEEPGALPEVAAEAVRWFGSHLGEAA